MAQIAKRGKYWWVDYRVGGRRVQRSLKTTQQRVALEALKAIDGDLVRGKMGLATQDLPLEAAAREFLEYQATGGGREGRGVSASWLDRSQKVLLRFVAAVPHQRLGSVTTRDIETYFAHRAPFTKGAGLNREWDVVRAFLRWAYRNRLLGDDLALRTKSPKAPSPKEIEFLQRDQIDQLLQALREPAIGGNGARMVRNTPLYEMAAVAIFAGLRRGEILHLRAVEDLDLEEKLIHVREKELITQGKRHHWQPKDRESRTVPLSSRLVAILSDWMARREPVEPGQLLFPSQVSTPLDADGVGHRLQKVGKRIGLRVNWNILRHTFGSQLAQAGVSLHIIAKLMGHSSVTVTERHYAGLVPEKLHKYVELLS